MEEGVNLSEDGEQRERVNECEDITTAKRKT